ncbi:MAG: hypothetical protein U0625_01675 [Phycisphaerales bacterium]
MLPRSPLLRASALLVALASVAGCSAPRTWPSPGTDQGFSADAPPLPQAVTAALDYAHAQIDPKGTKIFNLPQEINIAAWPTYERMLKDWKPMCPGDRGVWTVRQVRIDGGKAQVDIEYPASPGIYQTVTVHMAGESAGMSYKPSFLQYWRVPVKDPVCQQPLSVVEKACGASAADALRAQRAATAPAAAGAAGAAKPPMGKPAAADEPSK